MSAVAGLIAIIFGFFGIAMVLGFASILLSCYVLILVEVLKFVARKAGHRWVTIGLLLVVLSVVTGLSWNSNSCRVLLAGTLYFLPVIRLTSLALSKLKRKWSTNEKWYFCLLMFVSGWTVFGPLFLIPRVVWQSLGPILSGSKDSLFRL